MKKIGLVTLAVLSTLTLAACSQKTNQGNNENKVSTQQTQTETKGIVEYLNTVKSTKIYVADLDYDDFEGKDQYITDVILKEDGKFTSYVTALSPGSNDTGEISTLGVEFSKLLKMNDKELHKYIKETDKNYYESSIEKIITGLNDFQTNYRDYPERYNEPAISYLKDLYSKYDYNAFKKFKSTNKVEGELTTDNSGEYVETENVLITNYALTPDDPQNLINSDTTVEELESYLKQEIENDYGIDMEPQQRSYVVDEAFQPTQISIYNKKYTIINNQTKAFIIPTDENITFDSLKTKDKNITIND
ncbi:hypothetical protein STPL106120_07645 [Streptococcus pluranimalium]|uniref:hypothetical protein n=1 Tax=Streptococcus pluranimalium TaxID=82348 RepID=UPI0039E940CE